MVSNEEANANIETGKQKRRNELQQKREMSIEGGRKSRKNQKKKKKRKTIKKSIKN